MDVSGVGSKVNLVTSKVFGSQLLEYSVFDTPLFLDLNPSYQL